MALAEIPSGLLGRLDEVEKGYENAPGQKKDRIQSGGDSLERGKGGKKR